MRNQEEIKTRLDELVNTQKIANNQLKKCIKEGDTKEEIYWTKTVAEFDSQVYALRFALGECE